MENKRQKIQAILSKSLAIILVIMLTMFQILYVTTGVVEAVSESLEEQDNKTNRKNVTFDTYFKEETEKKHEAEKSMEEGAELTFNIGIDTIGELNNGKIEIEEANFKLKESENKYIKNINTETNEIELNKIIANDGIEITVPVEFKKAEELTKEYLEKETNVKLTGNYKNAEKREKAVKGETKIKLSWNQKPEIKINQDIEKYINLEGEVTLIQQRITIESTKADIVKSKKIETIVPSIQNIIPEQVEVLINGEQEEKYEYNQNDKKVIIKDDRKENSKREYKIIYTYPLKYEEEIQMTLGTKVESELYTEEVEEQEDIKEVKVNRTTNNVSIKKETPEKIYKGKLYSKIDKTEYKEKTTIEISNLDQINQIALGRMEDFFIDEAGNKASVNDKTYISNIRFNKENVQNILGEEFEIKILGIEAENKEAKIVITKNSNWDENGNISIPVSEVSISQIGMIFSQPKNIGELNIETEKYIKENADYNKQTLKKYKELENKSVVIVAGGEIEVTSTSKLEDTKTEANLQLSTRNLSIIEKNENVQMSAILKANNAEYDLYKNPYIEIKLPEELKEIEVKSINVVYGDELKIERARYNQQTKSIQMKFSGEQEKYKTEVEEGIHVIISADLTFEKNMPSKKSEIKMLYTNDNADERQHETSAKVNLNSKYGAILYNSIHDYNEEKEVIETTEDTVLYGDLDIDEKAKQAIVHQTFINNYQEPINQIAIIGKVAAKNTETKMNNIVTNNENTKIYYSSKENIKVEDKSWKENKEDVKEIKSYKIEVTKELEPESKIDIAYGIEIPEALQRDTKIEQNTDITYNYNGQELKTKAQTVLTTDEKPLNEKMVQNIKAKGITGQEEGIRTKLSVMSANKAITEDTELNEGQPISYTLTVTNNTGKDLNNFKFLAQQTNCIFYAPTEVQGDAVAEGSGIYIITKKDENTQNITENIEVIKNGETKTFTYQLAPERKEGNISEGQITLTADDIEEQKIQTPKITIKEAELEIDVINTIDERDVKSAEGWYQNFRFNITNKTNEEQKDIIIDIQTSTNLQTIIEEWDGEILECINDDRENKRLTFKINKLAANETMPIYIPFIFGKVSGDESTENSYIYYTAELNQNIYYSNTLIREFSRITPKLQLTQTSNIGENKVKIGDKIIYTLEIENKDKILNADNINIIHNVTEATAKIQRAYLKRENGEITDINIQVTNEVETSTSLKSGEKVEYIAEVNVDTTSAQSYSESVTSTASAEWQTAGFLSANEITNEVQYLEDKQQENPYEEEEENNNGNNNWSNNGNNGGSSNNRNEEEEEEKTYEVSGVVWLDKNKNGSRDLGEDLLEEVEVQLLDVETGEVVEYAETEDDGSYTFYDISQGNYIVRFGFDTDLYSVTQYQAEGVADNKNSDVMQKQLDDGDIVAMTNTLNVSDKNLKNIDAGFIQNTKFDFSLNKTINKVVTKSTEGTKEVNCSGSKLAKTDINPKYADNTTVTIEYNIEVKNEGEISGYVDDIIDYMPKDLKFNSEINPDWYEDEEGNLHNMSLSNTAIRPGESQSVTLILIKQMTTQNTGMSVNIAEIGQATNELSIEDEDSTPGNRKDGEDDISTAELLTSIKTGGAVYMSVSIILMIVLIGITVVIFRKREGGE